MCLAMARTAPARSFRKSASTMARCSMRFGGQAMVIVARFRVVPGRVAKGPKQVLQAAEFVDQERIPTPAGDQVVKHAIGGSGFRDCLVLIGRTGDHGPQIGPQALELIAIDPPASQANRLALQGTTNLANLAHLLRGHPPHDGAAVG